MFLALFSSVVPSLGSWFKVVKQTWTWSGWAAQWSLPSYRACVSRENSGYVCVCVCNGFRLACCHLLCLVPPLPSELFFCGCACLSFSPPAQEIHSRETNTNTQKEREELDDQRLVVTRASRLSISPPFPPDRLMASSQGLACKPPSHINPLRIS